MMKKGQKYSENEITFVQKLKKENLTWEEIKVAFSKKFKKNKTKADLTQLFIRNKNFNKKNTEILKPINDKKIYNSILVISDMHHPYSHPDTFEFLKALKKKYAFDKVLCIGDEVDFHALSFHDSNPDLPSAGYELSLAIKYLKPIYKLFPEVEVVESNHGSMVLRKALNAGMPLKAIRSYNEILEAPKGWEWKFDTRINTPIGEVYFCHGKSSSPGKMAKSYGMSVVQGHHHEIAQVTYISTPGKIMFDMHVGCLADDRSLALGYNKINPKRPIISVGIIIGGMPQVIPMILNSDYRWIGKI
jgi:predicted phosphodiesterase